MFLYSALLVFLNWIWGLPMLLFLGGGGVILTISVGFVQCTKFGYVMRHTFGKMFEKADKNGISGFQAVSAALSSTIGTGNIVGVGAAIAMGGPGAVFWMWLIGFVAMATKYCEVIASVKYREPNPNGGWFAGPYMYIRKGLGNTCFSRGLAVIWAISMIFACLVGAALHTGSTLDGLGTLNIPRVPLMIAILVLDGFVLFGGVRRLVNITDKLVPFMAAIYIIAGSVIIFSNIGTLASVIAMICREAFTGTSAVGGFAGSTLAITIRWGVARGMYSNDAGGGVPSIVHGQATCKHPVEQAMWGIFEVFFDTIVVCSFTAFVILCTGEWLTGAPGSVLAINAFATGLGSVGRILAPICLALFAISTVMAIGIFAQMQAENLWGTFASKMVSVLFLIMIVFGLFGVDLIIPFSDLANALVIIGSLTSLLFMIKMLRAETKDYFSTIDSIEKNNK
ncbi:sodium:alanine symporter family protein [Cloacibacillus evryensis]|uniref:alanine/glycine:cation symporter family protein n=1 Tax=Cloacibacillus evryensis TaxID=508460 RepID=UPI00210DC0A1|nr:amino acid carrier protein [Cloacibacillus evryensis]MCQ4765414.1 amino acid carrier protein [Cloacibacillus evryensis]